MKKEIPILFSTPMVQAILAGRKTMTRRIVKPKGALSVEDVVNHAAKCPYGWIDDILWVRESWHPYLRGYGENGWIELIKFVADGYEMEMKHSKDYSELGWHNRPSIHMPKDGARIWLLVVDISVERLHSITKEDAMDEGIEFEKLDGNGYKLYRNHLTDEINLGTAVESFQTLWKKINGEESWNKNPWVWVVSFKVISTTGKPYITKAENYDFNCRNNLQTS